MAKKGGCASNILLLALIIGGICLFEVVTKETLRLPGKNFFATCLTNSSSIVKNSPLLNNTELSKTLNKPKQIIHVWFVCSNKQNPILVSVERNFLSNNSLDLVIKELLDGPTDQELRKGLDSEIPKGTVLLGMKENKDSIELDLSQRFVSGGGTSSMELRLEQLKRTISELAGNRDVFLNIEGKRLTMTPGEGLEVKEPINR